MIPFKINGKKYNIPTRWEDVTYAQYVALLHTTSLTDYIHVFTGIPKELLYKAEIASLEKINISLAFLAISPKFERTDLIGRYLAPADVTLKSTGQFEDLRALLLQVPKDMSTFEKIEIFSKLTLHACAIYCQKERDGEYDPHKVPEVMEELKNYPCNEVIGNGTFFLSKPLPSLQITTNRYQTVIQRLKKWSQELPGYQKTLASLQRFFGLQEK